MDYNVSYSPSGTAVTQGFRRQGELEITADSLCVTGQQRELKHQRLARYAICACMAILIMLWVIDDQWNVLSRGPVGYWILPGWIVAFFSSMAWLLQEKKRTLIFPLTQLQQVICQNTNITFLLSSDNGEESIFAIHAMTSSTAQEIASAVEMRRPFAAPIWFGYENDVKADVLVPSGNGLLSLTDRQLVFSSLHRRSSISASETLLLLLIWYLINLSTNMLHGTTITAARVFAIIFFGVIMGVVFYLRHRRHPYTFSFTQVASVVPQGNALLLKIREASGDIRAILFQLSDISQTPALLNELQARKT